MHRLDSQCSVLFPKLQCMFSVHDYVTALDNHNVKMCCQLQLKHFQNKAYSTYRPCCLVVNKHIAVLFVVIKL